MNFFDLAEQALLSSDVTQKQARVSGLRQALTSLQVSSEQAVMPGNLEPGRPEKPVLVHPGKVKRRRLNTDRGRLALVHAVAHIEFNAINLALDAIWRFRGMPRQYYEDWLLVAEDESRHFGWLQGRLEAMGSHYGALPAHNGLWEAAVKTAADPLPRMALVPRVLEARGLDVTPGMITRLQAAGDDETVAILERILDEEVAHVEAGSRWYRYLCAQRSLDADSLFPQLLDQYLNSLPKPPFNFSARLRAGFSDHEISWLKAI